jgi:nitrous oxidase accessory protein NosD
MHMHIFRMKTILLLFLAFLMLNVIFASTGNIKPAEISPAVPITPTLPCGMNITQSTNLSGNILNCRSTAVNILADNVVLDCQGHRITGHADISHFPLGVSSTIYIDNVEVRNCTFDDFWIAVGLSGSGNRVHGNRILNSHTGVYSGSGHSQIFGNYFSGNLEGLHVNYDYNTIRGNFLNGTNIYGERGGSGVYLASWHNNVTGNFITGYLTGIYENDGWAFGNTMWNNSLVQNERHAEGINSTANSWNLSIVGNYWDDWQSNPGYPNNYSIVYYYCDDNGCYWVYGAEADFHPLQNPGLGTGPIFRPSSN